MGKCWWKWLKHVKLRLSQKLKITFHLKSWTQDHIQGYSYEDDVYLAVLKEDLLSKVSF